MRVKTGFTCLESVLILHAGSLVIFISLVIILPGLIENLSHDYVTYMSHSSEGRLLGRDRFGYLFAILTG